MKFAIHAHIYYRELWDELSGCIRNFPKGEYDLFVTTPHVDADFERRVMAEYPRCDYRVVENRGYDVGPFIDVLNRLDLSRYEFVVKLHTKRDFVGLENYIRFSGSKWRDYLLAFCKTPKNLSRTLNCFADPRIGMVGHPLLVIGTGDFFESNRVKKVAVEWVRKLGLKPARRLFVGGTMFVARAELFKCIQGKVSLDDFAPVVSHELGTLAHVYERVLGYMVCAQGKQIVGFFRQVNVLSCFAFVIVPAYRVLAFLRNQLPDRRRERMLDKQRSDKYESG